MYKVRKMWGNKKIKKILLKRSMEAHKEGLKKESSPMDFITVIEDKVAWATQFKYTLPN